VDAVVGDEVVAHRLAEAVAILEQHGRGEAAAAIRARYAAARDGPATVVVVGEAKRGKSSLINALLGVPEIAPTGTDIVTGAFVAYVPVSVSHEVPTGSARVHFADGASEDIAIAQVADWVTVDGARATDERGVIGATVHLGSAGPLELVLIDTPGVSGLVAGHGKIALRMARQAAALVFVSDVGQDFTAPEAAFLAEAAAGVDTVVFTFTKIDKYPMSWEKVVAHDRALLAEHLPRFADAPVIGVSALLAVDALDEPDPQVAMALEKESRIGLLVDTLVEVVASRAGQLARINTLRAVVSQLAEVEVDLAARLAMVNRSRAGAPTGRSGARRTECTPAAAADLACGLPGGGCRLREEVGCG
jgi:GTPase SAR1 family protein